MRRNYQNIGNNFISGGVYANQPNQQSPMNQRQTRSNQAPNQPPVQTPTVQPQSANIEIKTDPAPPPQAATITTEAPMEISPKEENADNGMSESDLLKLKKINFKKKVSGKEKRSKQNKKLYRMLTPRNAIAALNELTVGQAIGDTVVVPVQNNKFEAEVVLHNVKYKGVGNSKMAAKNSACEKALRDLVINKFKQAKQQDAAAAANPPSEDVNMEEVDGPDAASDVPMLQLASFALHKLFSEWEQEGFEVPFPKAVENPQATAPTTEATPPKAPSTPKPPKVKNDLPPNNITMHPVMLLSIMRPCTQYNDLGSQGITPNILHTVGATVDGQSFIGQGRSKKEARKRVATQILQKLFNWQGSCC